jgi:hypothetical protein
VPGHLTCTQADWLHSAKVWAKPALSNGIDLPERQRDGRHFRLSLTGGFACWGRPLHGLIAWCRSASPLRLFETRRNEQVQFSIIEVFDGVRQVFGQNMPLVLSRRDLLCCR